MALSSKINYPQCTTLPLPSKKCSPDSNQHFNPNKKTPNTKHQTTKNDQKPMSDARQVSGRLGMSVSD